MENNFSLADTFQILWYQITEHLFHKNTYSGCFCSSPSLPILLHKQTSHPSITFSSRKLVVQSQEKKFWNDFKSPEKQLRRIFIQLIARPTGLKITEQNIICICFFKYFDIILSDLVQVISGWVCMHLVYKYL